MNTISRTITGVVVVLFGLYLIVQGVLKDFWILIYGIPIVAIGVYIFFNKKEDDIEKIKSRKN